MAYVADSARRLRSIEGGKQDIADADSWTTDDEGPAGVKGYDPDKFYTSSRNKHDHSEQMSLKLPPDLYMAVQSYGNNQDFPEYRSGQDVVRDAIVHRLHYLTSSYRADPTIISLVRAHMTVARLSMGMAELDLMNKVVDDTRVLSDRLMNGRDIESMSRLIIETETAREVMREPYVSRIDELLVRMKDWVKREIREGQG